MDTLCLDSERDYGYQDYYSIQDLFYQKISKLDEKDRRKSIHKNQVKLYSKKLKKGKRCQKDIKM